MEKDRGGRILALAALLVGVIGLSLGFAAFSSTLNITSSANVELDKSVWKVGFSNTSSSIPSSAVTVNGQSGSPAENNGSISLTQFVISQATAATLKTENGSSVTYSFYIVNGGKLDAYLNSVSMGTLSCTYGSGSNTTYDNGHSTASAGTGTISAADCATLFTATLTIDQSSYTSGSTAVTSGFGNTNKIAATGTTYLPATLTIAYNADSISSVTTAPNGDFTVALSDTAIVYGTSSN